MSFSFGLPLRVTALSAAMMFWASSASAVTIFSDDFESGNLSNWAVSANSPTTVTNVADNGGRVMSFSQGDGLNPDATTTATTSIPNTSAYTNLSLSLQWWADGDNEANDTLLVQWAVAGSGSWNTIATLSIEGGGGYFSTGPLAINTVPSPGTDIDLRLAVNMSQTDERFRVDNIALSGDNVLPTPGPLVGAGLPGLVGAFLGFVAFMRRRRQLSA